MALVTHHYHYFSIIIGHTEPAVPPPRTSTSELSDESLSIPANAGGPSYYTIGSVAENGISLSGYTNDNIRSSHDPSSRRSSQFTTMTTVHGRPVDHDYVSSPDSKTLQTGCSGPESIYYKQQYIYDDGPAAARSGHIDYDQDQHRPQNSIRAYDYRPSTFSIAPPLPAYHSGFGLSSSYNSRNFIKSPSSDDDKMSMFSGHRALSDNSTLGWGMHEDSGESVPISGKKNVIKRPMNSFMVYAQEHRPLLKQQYPHKYVLEACTVY